MIELRRVLRRTTTGRYRILYQSARPIVVELMPGDVLTFREKGRKQRFHLPIEEAFRIAVRRHASK